MISDQNEPWALAHRGMSGCNLTVIPGPNGDILEKRNGRTGRIQREADGHQMLQRTSIAGRLLPILSFDGTTIAYPYLGDHIDLRRALAEGRLQPQAILRILQSVIETKTELWRSTKRPPEPSETFRSMLREEWDDTLLQCAAATGQIETQLGIDSIEDRQLVVNGRPLPSLTEVITRVDTTLSRPASYVVTGHNDTSGANILVHPDHPHDGFYLVDYEWAGAGDPAEAFVRASKWVSTSSLHKDSIEIASRADTNGTLIIDGVVEAPEENAIIHDEMQGWASAIGTSLGDPEFEQRSREYLAASYLREYALGPKRGGPDASMTALILAGQQLAHC